jgi:micrococcal nuclease
MYEYRAKVVRVIDGDTIDFDIDLGFSTWQHTERVRLYGIDAPEVKKYRGVTDEEKALGLALKARLEILMPVDSYVTLRTVRDTKGKFGRYLGIVTLANGVNLNDWLVAEGLVEAKIY